MKKKYSIGLIMVLGVTVILSGCASMNKSQKGAVIGTVTGDERQCLLSVADISGFKK